MAIVRIQDLFKGAGASQNFVFVFKANLKTSLGSFASVPTVIPVDATLNENYSLSSEMTENEVQSGSVLTDHIHIRPQTISVKCVISESPVFFVPSAAQALIDLGVNRSFEALSGATRGTISRSRFAPVLGSFEKYANDFVSGKISAKVLGDGRRPRSDVQRTFWISFLKARFHEKQTFKIQTQIDVLDNVFFESISFDRTYDMGDSIIFDCVLKELRVIKSDVVITNKAGYAHRPVARGNAPLRAIALGLSGSGGGGIASEALENVRQVFPSLPAGAVTALENKIITPINKAEKKLRGFFSNLFN